MGTGKVRVGTKPHTPIPEAHEVSITRADASICATDPDDRHGGPIREHPCI